MLAEVRTGDRQLRGTSGVADLDSRQPVNGNGFFRIGSNTKTFLSVVVLQLVAEHRLSLDDTAGRWLPGVVHGNGNDGGKITVRELLQHTSGLHDYTDDLQAQITSPEAYRRLEFRQFSRSDLLDIALAHRPDSAPGAAWNYSNTNYILLGMVIEKVTHDSWENQVTRRIIIPLGLRHTYAPGTSTRLPAPHATGYLIFDKNTRIDTTAENMSWADSAGALISTAADLTRFWSAIGRGALLGPAQTREMRQTVPATGGDSASVPGSGTGWASSSSRSAAAAATGHTRATYPGTTPSAPSAATGAPRPPCPSTPTSTSTTRYWPPNTASSTTSCATADTGLVQQPAGF